ncbi:hypothetical protein [Nocardioides sp.]|uniref:hypothetical protein n=1 Tax=Nocardioides sp. TaxID=35761 RepID=UPI003D14C43E
MSSRVGDLSEFDHQASESWQDYIVEHLSRRRGDFLELIIRDDVDDYTFSGRRMKTGKIVARATVPASWFTGASSIENRPVHRMIKQRFFTDLAVACALPPPPPPPVEQPYERSAYGGYTSTFWEARRKGFRRPEFHAADWFKADPLWQDYLALTEGDTLSLMVGIVDREKPRRYGRAKPNGEIDATVDLPIDWFVDNDDPDLTVVEAIRDTYVWGMTKFGWPEPPPLPKRPPPPTDRG